jgi:hypothetical protein
MKKVTTLALVVLALAVVPVALADTTPVAPTPVAPVSTATPAQQHAGLGLRIVKRLAKLDARLQARIVKIQEKCPAGSTDQKCTNADARIARLQKLDARIQALVAGSNG